jgi:hypothetical protein
MCPPESFGVKLRQISSKNNNEVSDEIKFCRLNKLFTDSTSTKDYELGTREFPFKNIYWPVKEVFYSL